MESSFKKGVIMAMKFLCMFMFMSSCSKVETYEREEIVFPNKELQEIIFEGSYYPEKKLKKSDYTRENYGPVEKIRKEKYRYSGEKYCYNKTVEEDKKQIKESVDENFKAQLYNKEGELLTETFFIVNKFDTKDIYDLTAYLPFQESGYETRIVRIDKNKEIILDTTILIPLEELVHKVVPLDQWGLFWRYDPEIECFMAPGPR